MQVDKQSGFNMLQAAVFEGKYDIVLEASGLFDNFVEEMKLTRTGKNAKGFLLIILIIMISKVFMKNSLRTTAD